MMCQVNPAGFQSHEFMQNIYVIVKIKLLKDKKSASIPYIYTPAQWSWRGGYTGFTLSVCPSVRLSVDDMVSRA